MTPSELAALAQSARETPLTLLLDTNAVAFRRLLKLADAVAQWQLAFPGAALRLCISPLVFAERNAQERRQRGRDFKLAQVQQTLESKCIEIAPFDAQTADRTSERLADWFPTQDQWREAKWECTRKLYGEEGAPKPRPGRHLSATVDWYIAASVPDGAVLVTDDTGVEFARVQRTISYASAVAAFAVRPAGE